MVADHHAAADRCAVADHCVVADRYATADLDGPEGHDVAAVRILAPAQNAAGVGRSVVPVDPDAAPDFLSLYPAQLARVALFFPAWQGAQLADLSPLALAVLTELPNLL